MKRSPTCLALLLLLACQKPGEDPGAEAGSPVAAAIELASQQTLYLRLGGYDALAMVTDDFLARLLGDEKMAPYFENVDDAGKKRLRQMLVDQLCASTGGPCIYVGADMPTAHKDLNISATAFDVAAQYLTESLNKFGVPGKERNELMAVVAGMKEEIVGK